MNQADGPVGEHVIHSGEPLPPWIARAISGDADALRELWKSERRWVAAVLIAHAPGDADIDDLLQEVALTVVAKISGLREPGAFKPWLRAVTLSVAKTAARKGNVRKAGWRTLLGLSRQRQDEGDVERHAPGVSDAAVAEGRRLLDLSADLPDGYREPLLLKCVQGMSYKQIGLVMGLPDTTIETRIARARRMLRDKAVAAGSDTQMTTRTHQAGSTQS